MYNMSTNEAGCVEHKVSDGQECCARTESSRFAQLLYLGTLQLVADHTLFVNGSFQIGLARISLTSLISHCPRTYLNQLIRIRNENGPHATAHQVKCPPNLIIKRQMFDSRTDA